MVCLRDPVTNVDAIFPPGGAIETGETAADAAARETFEETGLRVRVDEASRLVAEYPYRWAGEDIACTTELFVVAPLDPPPSVLPRVVDAPYHRGASWMPIDEALASMPPIVAAPIRALLRSR